MILVRVLFAGCIVVAGGMVCRPARCEAPAPIDGAKFYDSQVRPILEAHCYACHGGLDGKKLTGGFSLSSREELLKGGEDGPAISLEKPGESVLIRAINYQELEMPPKGKLPQSQIDILTKWVEM